MAISDLVDSFRCPCIDGSVRASAPMIRALEGAKPPSKAVRDSIERPSSFDDCEAKSSAILSSAMRVNGQSASNRILIFRREDSSCKS